METPEQEIESTEQKNIKTTSDDGVDAFILFNEKEKEVESIVNFLESTGIKTHYWKRDTKLGEDWREFEDKRNRNAKLILLFLGNEGWGPIHEPKAIEAEKLGKRILPILMGFPKDDYLDKANGIFRRLRYFPLPTISNELLNSLVIEIQKLLKNSNHLKTFESQQSNDYKGVLGLITGNHKSKLKIIQQLFALSKEERKKASIEVLSLLDSSPREVQVNTTWISTALLIVAPEYDRTRDFILLSFANTDWRRKFWILANAWNMTTKASYLGELLRLAQNDSHSLINSLADALNLKESFFAKISESKEFEGDRVNDLLRILSVTWGQGYREHMGQFFFQDGVDFWWLIKACWQQDLSARFYDEISLEPGLGSIVQRSLDEIRLSQGSAIDDFAIFLSQFEEKKLNEALKQFELAESESPYWSRLRKKINNSFREQEEDVRTHIHNDTINSDIDLLEIGPEVKTLTAVMITKELRPPLAIGLFGDWGSGKSYFMHCMRKEIDRLQEAKLPAYCSSVVQIEFNAWHYVETNLWASLTSTILEKLIEVVEPKIPIGEQEISLLNVLSDSKKVKADAETEKKKLQEQFEKERADLLGLEQKRLTGKFKLKEFSLIDIPKLLENEQLKQFKETFEELGLNQLYRNVEEFESKLDEVKSMKGRFWTLVLGIAKSKNWLWILFILALILVIIPWGWGALKAEDWWPSFAKSISAITVQLSSTLVSIGGALIYFVRRYSKHLGTLEQANKKIQEVFQKKRSNPDDDEKKLTQELIKTETQILETESIISATADKIQIIEKKIFDLKNENSLAHFLKTRTGSADYQKHLGLVSIIRRDFETLSRILLDENIENSTLKKVDRIVLYIDDLDRCPEKTVIEVLQAVHLLLAYPLFVVVVGVDSRWLMHSLKKEFGAFASSSNISAGEKGKNDLEEWKTTPQNFLEKIFQIPFHLKPMGDQGFGNMMRSLMSSSESIEPNSGQNINPSSRGLNEVNISDSSQLTQINENPTVHVDAISISESKNTLDDEDDEEPIREIAQEALRITPWESEFASKLHAFIKTPRTAKRFTNIYRLIKASVQKRELKDFEGTFDALGEFQVPMLLLSITIGSPEFCKMLIPKLKQHGIDVGLYDPPELNTEFEKAGFGEEWNHWKVIAKSNNYIKIRRLLEKWFPKVARFSFEIGKMELN